jgi:hypothetical protein
MGADVPKLTLTCPDGPSATGAVRLSWSGPDGAAYRLEQDAAVIYEGADSATTVTGLSAGSYAFRVGALRDQTVDAWSVPCTIDVAPPSLGMALVFFAVGAGIAFATVLTILRGHRAHRRGEIG